MTKWVKANERTAAIVWEVQKTTVHHLTVIQPLKQGKDNTYISLCHVVNTCIHALASCTAT